MRRVFCLIDFICHTHDSTEPLRRVEVESSVPSVLYNALTNQGYLDIYSHEVYGEEEEDEVVAGKVCFTRLQDGADIVKFVNKVHKLGALAVLGIKQNVPYEALELPFFAIDDESGKGIGNAVFSRVKFTTLDSVNALPRSSHEMEPKQFLGNAMAAIRKVSGRSEKINDITANLLLYPDWTVKKRMDHFRVAYQRLESAITNDPPIVDAVCGFVAKQLRATRDLLYLSFATTICLQIESHRKGYATLMSALGAFFEASALTKEGCEDLRRIHTHLPSGREPRTTLYTLTKSINRIRTGKLMKATCLMNVFAVWYHCRPEIENYTNLVSFLRSVMSAEFAMTHLDDMISYSDRDFCMVCCACLQSTPGDMKRIISRCSSDQETVEVQPVLLSRLVAVIRSLGRRDSSDDEFIKEQCSDCLQLLGMIKFRSQEKGSVMLEICNLATFHARRTFRLYGELYSLISVEHHLHRSFTACLHARLHRDMKSLGTTQEAVRALTKFLESDAVPLLTTREATLLLEKYSLEVMNGHTSTRTKVSFLQALFKMWVKKNCVTTKTSHLENYIEKMSLLSRSTTDVLGSVLVMSISNPSVFSIFENDETTFSKIAKVVVLKENAELFLREHQSMKAIFTDFRPVEEPSLFSSLTRHMVETLGDSWETLVTASRANVDLCHSGELPALRDHVLLPVLDNALERWKPRSIEDILSRSANELRYVLGSLAMTAGLSSHSENCSRLIAVFEEKFKRQQLRLCDYEYFSSQAETENWSLVEGFIGRKLPTKEAIARKIQEGDELRERVEELNSVHSTSLETLLNRYNCVPAAGSKLAQFLALHRTFTLPAYANAESTPTLADMPDLVSYAEEFVHLDHGDCLDELDSLYPSVCFNYTFQTCKRDGDLDFNALRETFSTASKKVRRLFGSESNFFDVDRTIELLTKNERSFEEELKVLEDSGLLDNGEEDKHFFLLLGVIAEARQPLQGALSGLEKLQFEACDVDQNFQAVRDLVHQTFDDRHWEELKQQSCVDFARQCIQLIGTEEQPESIESLTTALRNLLPCFKLIEVISRNGDVWKLTDEMQWFGGDGLARFFEEFNNVTNSLLGNSDSYEMSVLHALMAAVRALSAVGGAKNMSSVVSVLSYLKAHKDLASISIEQFDCNLQDIQREISLVRDWFKTGNDELSNSLSILMSAFRNGNFVNEAVGGSPRKSLSLLYIADADVLSGMSRQRRLDQHELQDFATQLELVGREGHASVNIHAFLEQYYIMVACSRLASELERFGYEQASGARFRYRIGSEGIQQAKSLQETLERDRIDCHDWLARMRAQHPLLLLFWMEELQTLHSALVGVAETPDKRTLFRATSLLLKAVQRGRDKEEVTIQGAEKLVCDLLHSKRGLLKEQETSWLAATARFLHCFQQDMAFKVDPPRAVGEKSTLVLHTLAVDDSLQTTAVHAIMQSIYKERLPFGFEVLDGRFNATIEKVDLFLKRSRAFTAHTFVITYADRMDGLCLEEVMSFLSSREVSLSGVNLHCIQREGSILQKAPWVLAQRWDANSVNAAMRGISSWRQLVLDGHVIREVTVVHSPVSGSGKTRWIAQQLGLAENFDVAESARLAIHEQSTLASLTGALSQRVLTTSGVKALHLSITCIPSRGEDRDAWLETIEYFFFALLVLRDCSDPSSGTCNVLHEGQMKLYVELPSESGDALDWLRVNIPILQICGKFVEPPKQLELDDESYRVCVYLRAYRDKTIDRKFSGGLPKTIVLVLDVSGSMDADMGGRTALVVAVDNALMIFDRHVTVGDHFGVILFDHKLHVLIAKQTVMNERHRSGLRTELDAARRCNYGGGTAMYQALSHAVDLINDGSSQSDAWIVCLTDGASADSDDLIRRKWARSPKNHNLIVVGVNLKASIEDQIRHVCAKFDRFSETKGFFVRSEANAESLTRAFIIVSTKLAVSQTFELDGAIGKEECEKLIRRYIPDRVRPQDMLLRDFWLRFLYRRVKVFDKNKNFNYNETHDNLGSTLMEVMLGEAESLLGENHSCEWQAQNYSQLIYDFKDEKAPEFRLVCTSPRHMDPNKRKKLESLDLPGFAVPTDRELKDINSLIRFLSQAMTIPLSEHSNGEKYLESVYESGFVLTLDFTMKLLRMHERVVCRTPCIVEGETGVSKTALTKMYSMLRNESVRKRARAMVESDLEEMAKQLGPYCVKDTGGIVEGIANTLSSGPQDHHELFGIAKGCIMNLLARRPQIFAEVPASLRHPPSCGDELVAILNWFKEAHLEELFFEMTMDSSLTEDDIVNSFIEARRVARKVQSSGALVVVFIDEINTCSVLGILKEIIVDRTIGGDMIESNIVVVAACNPAGRDGVSSGRSAREVDLGREWVSGHYQVHELPRTLNKLKWWYGALNRDQEKEFIWRRVRALGCVKLSDIDVAATTELVAEAQDAVRTIASVHIRRTLMSQSYFRPKFRDQSEMEAESAQRARSVVSLRDIQRVLSLFEFFIDNPSLCRDSRDPWEVVTIAVSIVYYMRLTTEGRRTLSERLRDAISTRVGRILDIEQTLSSAIDCVLESTAIPPGIAQTRGLRENIFMTLVCTTSRTPLMIMGPPGCSKTLSVNVVADNANGQDSPHAFFRHLPRLSFFHYQCSRQSTSREISAVFENALQRQRVVDVREHLCVVFMDEAGLPEEAKESLKVLHYLLEGHMSIRSDVGFVAITNHVLDAAKSNRCVVLLREEPDAEEMNDIVWGVLFDHRSNDVGSAIGVSVGDRTISASKFSKALYSAYDELAGQKDSFAGFFGLRDLIYMLKSIKKRSCVRTGRMTITLGDFIASIERNFNGKSAESLSTIVSKFLSLLDVPVPDQGRHTMSVLVEALRDQGGVDMSTKPRFKLIIDKTKDDSILRILQMMGLVDRHSPFFKMSHMPEETEREKLRLIVGIKLAALQGSLALLSQTESINESFYDLFNQNFRAITREGKTSLYSTIAVGGISRRSRVDPNFECIVHIRDENVDNLPAPFLNRFEKYSLCTGSVLEWKLSTVGPRRSLFEAAHAKASSIVGLLGEEGFVGRGAEAQTLSSVFLDMIIPPPQGQGGCGETNEGKDHLESGSIIHQLTSTIQIAFESCTTLRFTRDDIESVVKIAQVSLDSTLAAALEDILDGKIDVAKVKESMENILWTEKPQKSTLDSLCAIVLRMVVVRAASFRIFQLATPEAIFSNRNRLPEDLLSGYFEQEHFSLKRLLKGLVSRAQSLPTTMTVVHTRSDAFIHSIPATRKGCVFDEAAMGKLRCLYEPVEELCVEHFSRLRTEQGIRKLLDEWGDDSRRTILLMFADMSCNAATEQINYTRMLVEARRLSSREKSVVFVLHYPPSSLLHSAYPALFLGGWDHIFLDGISSSSRSTDVAELVRKACIHGEAHQIDLHERRILSESLMALLPRVVPLIAAHGLLECGKPNLSFSSKTGIVTLLLNRRVCSSTVADSLCSRFAHIWLSQGLMRTMTRASQSLVAKTTQLSMSTSINSVLQETFTAFVTAAMQFINQWNNAQFLTQRSHSRECEAIIELVLNDLPVPPFEELLLHQSRKSTPHLLPFAVRSQCPRVRFPFFYFVSSFLDEVVESAEREVASSDELELVGPANVLKYAHALVANTSSIATGDSKFEIRRQLVGQILQLVANERGGPCPENLWESSARTSLFDDYLQQFVEWKVGCPSSRSLVCFFRERIIAFDEGRETSLLAIHVAARAHETELIRAAAASVFIHRFKESIPGAQRIALDNESDLFPTVIHHYFETVARGQDYWCAHFWNFLLHSTFLFGEEQATTDSVLSRVRALLFVFIMETSHAENSVESKQHWLIEGDQRFLTLENFVGALRVRGRARQLATKEEILMLQVFFSRPWLLLSRGHNEEDFMFLLSFIEGGALAESKRDFAVAVMDNFLSMSGGATGLSGNEALVLDSRLGGGTKDRGFPKGGTRRSLPHFIPAWLACSETNKAQRRNGCHAYFENFVHSFRGDLSNVLFHVLLKRAVYEASNRTSEELFVQFEADIDRETRLKQDHTPQSRGAPRAVESLRGTQVAAMLLDAKLVAFVCSVAAEVAISEEATVLEGVYRERAIEFLSMAMTTTSSNLQSLFFATIMRIAGDTRAFSLVTEGSLSHLDWCERWASGVPRLQEEARTRLERAETALREFVAEEKKKCGEWRLCPRCRKPFIVDKRNCGHFSCGRTTPYLKGGTDFGCGAHFNVDAAGFYKFDEDGRRRLKRELDSVRDLCATHDEDSALWQSAREMHIPAVWAGFNTEATKPPILPAITVPRLDLGGTSSVDLLSLLTRWREYIPQLRILPALIELYTWLHTSLRYVLSKQKAYSLRLGALMTDKVLARRYDKVGVDHRLAVWDRIISRQRCLLESLGGSVTWGCEQIKIPFDSLTEVPVATLLSEGDDPSDGNDFLFLLINHLVERYNGFCTAFKAFLSTKDDNDEVQPRFIVTGSGGIGVLGTVVCMNLDDLSAAITSTWDSVEQSHDLNALREVLARIVESHSARFIASPLSALREKFRFLDDTSEPKGVVGQGTANVLRARTGALFANAQDHKLFQGVWDLYDDVRDCDIDMGEWRATFTDQFFSLDYERIRMVLEGCRNLGHLVDEGGGSITVSGILRAAGEARLAKLGFPALDKDQEALLLGLDMPQLLAFVDWLGHQLASESHQYVHLPLCMTDPLKTEDLTTLMDGSDALCSERGFKACLDCLDEFVDDVLTFYERQIRDKALAVNEKMTTFLESQNFCDSSDPFFALLSSTDVKVRNYTALRQAFHQTRATLCFHNQVDDDPDVKRPSDFIERPTKHLSATRGHCWLWDERDDPLPAEDTEVVLIETNELWFDAIEQGSEKDDFDHPIDDIDAMAYSSLDGGDIDSADGDADDEQHEFKVESSTRQQEKKKLEKHEGMEAISIRYDTDEGRLRQWLDEHRLPQSLMKELNRLGARNVDDVLMLAGSDYVGEMNLKPLDLIKLRGAVKQHKSGLG